MRAAIFQGPKDIEVGERPDPVIEEPTDAVVRVVLACVCGSDLWYYRGESEHAVGSIGHEFIGVVEDVGTEVTGRRPRRPGHRPVHLQRHDLPALPERLDDLVRRGGNFGDGTIDGGQGEAVRVPARRLARSCRCPAPGTPTR